MLNDDSTWERGRAPPGREDRGIGRGPPLTFSLVGEVARAAVRELDGDVGALDEEVKTAGGRGGGAIGSGTDETYE